MQRLSVGRTPAHSACALAVLLLMQWPGPGHAEAQLSVPDFQVSSWQREDGLPDNTINALAQTPEGYLWIGTPKGLARFDGVRFKTFGPNHSPAFRDPNVTALLTDRSGALWIGTDSGEVVRFASGEFQGKLEPPDTAGARIATFAQDERGTIWMAVRGTNGSRVAVVESAVTVPTGEFPTPFGSLLSDTTGRVWGTSRGQILSLRDGYWTYVDEARSYPNADMVLAASRDGGLLTCTGGWWLAGIGLIKLKEGNLAEGWGPSPWIKSPRSRVTAILEDKSGRLFLGTAGNGLYYAVTNGVWEAVAKEGLSSQTAINCLFEDRAGSIWTGTQAGGLHRVRARLVKRLYLPTPAQNYIFLSVSASHDGSVWVGVDGAGVFHYQDGRFAQVGRHDATNLYAITLLEDRKTNLWIGSAGGFWRLRGGEIETAPGTPRQLKNVQALLEDSEGRLWIGALGKLVCKQGNEFRTVFAADNQNRYDIRSIAEGPDGVIWAADHGQGIHRIHRDQRQFFGKQDDPALPLARFVHIDDRAVLWIGTYGGGLLRFDGTRFARFTVQDGLPSDELVAVAEDRNGTLWIGSHNGIFGCAKADLERYERGRTLRLLCRHLLPAEGLASRACSSIGQFGAVQTGDGRLWFCNSEALVVLNPDSFAQSSFQFPVLVDEVTVDGVERRPVSPGSWTVPANARRFGFHYTAPALQALQNQVFRYRLEGMDREWVEAGSQRVASYSKLPAGRYRFRVMVGDEANGWREAAEPARLEVVPQWWQSLWFKLLIGAGLVGAIGGGAALNERRKLRRRLERLEMQQALENERRRIARDLHDDLGAQMTEIVLAGEVAKRGDQNPATLKEQISRLTNQVRQLVTSMEETVWTVNPKNDSLPNLASYLCDYTERFLDPTPIGRRLEVAENLPEIPLAAQTRHNLFLAFKEALNNAVKYSRATEINLRIQIESGWLVIRIEDNGCGFDPKQAGRAQGSGNGLPNLRSRLQSLGGRAEIASQAGRGTTVALSLPLPQQRATPSDA